jgi:hypothetical protein
VYESQVFNAEPMNHRTQRPVVDVFSTCGAYKQSPQENATHAFTLWKMAIYSGFSHQKW